jgi:hypothetical protein
MVTALQTAHAAMLGVLGRANIHLRVNIALETTRKRLRIAYSFNMDNDADDRLEFDPGGGACGLCWKIHDFVICDLEDAKKTFAKNWGRNKYQQAAVRPSLRSLLSVPIFDRKKYDGNRPDIENPRRGSQFRQLRRVTWGVLQTVCPSASKKRVGATRHVAPSVIVD